MSEKNWREKFFIYCMISTILNIIIIHIAMLFYAGGTIVNPYHSEGYSYSANFIGDLGFCTARSRNANTVSCTLWFIGGLVGSIGYILFAIAFRKFFTEIELENRLSTVGTICLIIFGIFYNIVALIMYNVLYRYPDVVMILTILYYTGTIAVILYLIVIFHNKEFPNRISLSWIIVLGFGYITLLIGFLLVGPIVGPFTAETTEEALMFWVVREKIAMYITIPAYLYLNYKCWKEAKS